MRILRWLIALAANYASGLDIFGSEIDSVDPAPVPAGNEPRGPAKATSDIKNMQIGRDTELIDEMFGCLAAAGMKLVYGPEIIDGHRIDRLAERLDPAADRGNQIAMRVVRGDVLLSGHWTSRIGELLKHKIHCTLIRQLYAVYAARRDRLSPFERERPAHEARAKR